jgi:LacI family transcriptional regulator
LKSYAEIDSAPATLEMVAHEAGVSPSTVSRILNGTAKVSEEKSQAVHKAIAKLNFIPNPIAQGLARGKSQTIGVVTQAIDSPFFGEGLRGIEDRLEVVGYTPLFISGHFRQNDERECFKQLLARRVDGIIVLHGCLPNSFFVAQAKRVPLVVTGRSLSAKSLHSIHFDNFEGARLATQHLLELGHQQIACITGPSEQSNSIDRLRGYQTALTEAGIAIKPELTAQGDFREFQGGMAVQQLIDSRVPFSAILACNDQSAYGAALQLYRKGLRVPDDISLVGFDDLRSSSFTIPPLTTVRIGIYDIGKAAAMAIVDLIEGRIPHNVAPPPELIVRESTKRVRS